MNDFVIYTDTACDVSCETLSEWGVLTCGMTFRFGDDGKEYKSGDMSVEEFYKLMREGSVAKTAAINSESFRSEFEKTLSLGKDILYIGFSSGLSGTYNTSRITAEELSEAYPERKVVTVDSLSASGGQALLVYLVNEKKKSGASLSECAEYAEEIKLSVSHWFTVDDLVYLKRGGRVSPTLAFIGNALGLKPVLHVDNEGHLVSVSKARGRKKSLSEMADVYGKSAKTPNEGTVFISHADCPSDAEELARMLKENYGVSVKITSYIGPVVGAHSGPGTLALFFVGNYR